MGRGVTRRVPRDLAELHRAVHELVARGVIDEPDEWPTYERSPAEPGMGVAWYWTPARGRREVLGSNVFLALRALRAHEFRNGHG